MQNNKTIQHEVRQLFRKIKPTETKMTVYQKEFCFALKTRHKQGQNSDENRSPRLNKLNHFVTAFWGLL